MMPPRYRRFNNYNTGFVFNQNKIPKIREEPAETPRQAGGDGASITSDYSSTGKSAGKRLTAATSAVRVPACRVCGSDSTPADNTAHSHLQACFGVQVPPSSALCEECVRLASIVAQYRNLVLAAFHCAETSTTNGDLSKPASKKIRSTHTQTSPGAAPRRRWLPLPRRRRRPVPPLSTPTSTKVSISCSSCRQRYVMMVPADGFKCFLCSRCKKNAAMKSRESKKYIPQSVHDRRSSRSASRASLSPGVAYGHLAKYRCSRCRKQYSLVQNLAEHERTVHDLPDRCISLEQQPREQRGSAHRCHVRRTR